MPEHLRLSELKTLYRFPRPVHYPMRGSCIETNFPQSTGFDNSTSGNNIYCFVFSYMLLFGSFTEELNATQFSLHCDPCSTALRNSHPALKPIHRAAQSKCHFRDWEASKKKA